MSTKFLTFQEIIFKLQTYWSQKGCAIMQPYDCEVGAGTFHPATFLRAIGPEPWSAAYVQGCRRPTDGRYGDNPNRLQHYYQFQVIMKPAPENVQTLYINSLAALGIDPAEHDIRFVEDDWESAAIGAWGLGWEVWLDGMEETQFTYFQQVGGVDMESVPAEITYGLERIAMFVQKVDNVYDLKWNDTVTYGDVHHQGEVENSIYNFEVADVAMLSDVFSRYEKESERLADQGLVLPAWDCVLKCSQLFNLLDARGAISVTQRTGYVSTIRLIASKCCVAYAQQRKDMGYPLMNKF